MERLTSVILLLFGFTLFAFGQNSQKPSPQTIANQMVQTALAERQAYRWLEDLCTTIGPRLSGSKAAVQAAHWAADILTANGADTVWLQPVMVPHWVRGSVEELTVHAGNGHSEPLSITALGGTIGTPPEGITAPVIRLKNFDELKARRQEVAGKIVFFDFPMDAKKVNTFRAYGEAVQYRVFGAIRAARYGARAVLIRSVTTRYDDVPHTGVMIYADSVRKIPAAALSWQAADTFNRLLDQHPNITVTLRLSAQILADTLNYNVIGEIRGTEKPDEIIVVGGHLDSWDVGCGAHDDGAGIVQAMEVLSLFHRLQIRPKRTIRCVLFINEENGSRGARAYAEFAKTEGRMHYAAMESDRGGFTPRGFTTSADSAILAQMQAWLPYLRTARIEWIRKGGSGADVSRIPNCPIKMGYFPDDQRYFDFHHSANDVFSGVHPRELELGSAAMGIMTYLLSETDIQMPTGTNRYSTH